MATREPPLRGSRDWSKAPRGQQGQAQRLLLSTPARPSYSAGVRYLVDYLRVINAQPGKSVTQRLIVEANRNGLSADAVDDGAHEIIPLNIDPPREPAERAYHL